jgi:hypothetical protein
LNCSPFSERRIANKQYNDAERRYARSHAERGNEPPFCGKHFFSNFPVVPQFSAAKQGKNLEMTFPDRYPRLLSDFEIARMIELYDRIVSGQLTVVSCIDLQPPTSTDH